MPCAERVRKYMACLSGFLLMAGLLIVGCRTHQKGTASGMSPDELQTEASDEGWKIDPDSVQAEFALVPGELNEKKVLRLVAVDEKQSFLRYRVCQTEASGISQLYPHSATRMRTSRFMLYLPRSPWVLFCG